MKIAQVGASEGTREI